MIPRLSSSGDVAICSLSADDVATQGVVDAVVDVDVDVERLLWMANLETYRFLYTEKIW